MHSHPLTATWKITLSTSATKPAVLANEAGDETEKTTRCFLFLVIAVPIKLVNLVLIDRFIRSVKTTSENDKKQLIYLSFDIKQISSHSSFLVIAFLPIFANIEVEIR